MHSTGKGNGFARIVDTSTKGYVSYFFVLNIRFLTFDELFVFRLIPRKQSECAGMFFEEQGPGFRCPQCSGPRRRYAKKVGDVVGTTLHQRLQNSDFQKSFFSIKS